ncbi:glutathione S-transferase Mu 2 [Nematostella vectensis]|uniref:glutathione S-transferase Mu 2 n=1 Tax=Nematostella vectensis TaxID=45351 RepID=UPI002076DDFF|nr:glutathione S-transferase Mu 2 [Nematostella vectensis]
MAPIFGYWKLRGLAEGVRYLLAYTNTEYERKDYVTGDAPDFNKDGWLSEKENIGLLLPNLPYYIDGDIRLTQTSAIMRHIARQHDLCGKTEEEKCLCDMIDYEIKDFFPGFFKATYFTNNFEEDIKVYLKGIRTLVKRFANFLGTNPYFAGQNLTFADFNVWEALDQLRTLDPTILDGHDNLKGFMKRIQELPGVREYMASEFYHSLPISNKMAKWGTQPNPPPVKL